MNKQDMMKIQTCVLRVNIHCDCEGCMHKVIKKLKKVKGVHKVNIDAAQGKVTVSGNADPASLIEKLEKAGKHAELWGGPQKGGPIFISNDQLKKFQIESVINKNGKQQQQHKKNNGVVEVPHQKKGVVSKEEKFPSKDLKSVKFNLPEDEDDEDDDDYDDEYDEDDDEFDDEFDEGDFDAHHKPPAKAALAKPNKAAAAAAVAHHPKGGKDGKDKKGGGGGGGGGGGIDMFLKGMLRKAGGKKGKSDKSSKKGDNKKDDGGKNGGKKGGFGLGDAKKGKNEGGWSKKGGDNLGKHQQKVFNEMKMNHKGGGGGGGDGGVGGRNVDMMGQMGGFPAVAGMPAMNGGRFVGGGPSGINPYSQQQQYMAQMMMMNQQGENGHGAYHPLAYGRPPPPAMSYGPPPQAMGYGPPPPGTDQYTHMFSDENTGSCSVM